MAELEAEFTRIFEAYYPYAYRRAFLFLRDHSESHDIAQSSFLKILQLLQKNLKQPITFRFIIRITTNLCLDRLKARRVRKTDPTAAIEQLPDNNPGSFTRVLVNEIINKLPTKLQEMAVYQHLDGLTVKEIARVTSLSERTVARRLGRIRDSLAVFA